MVTPEQEYTQNLGDPQSHNVQAPLDMSHSYSVNTIPSVRDYIISEDLLAGQRLDGRMSNVRRFFCLFVTFDLLLTSLMWIICVMLNGEYIFDALTEQVIHYNIHTSLFDIVLLAMCRFILLILFYALCYINHWIVISFSTAFTCGLLITKVFYYDWPHSSQPIFEVLLVLTSFILSWGEAWFLDFRVLPQETHANRYLITATETERTPLIRSYVQGLPSLYTESIGNFYSPQGTPEASLYRFEQTHGYQNKYPPVRFSREQEENYKALAASALQESWDIFQKKDWKLQKQNENDYVYIRVDSNGKKMFKLQTQFDVSCRFLMEELYFRVHDIPRWNSAIKEAYKIQTFGEHTDVTYHISKDGAGGLVSSRDFVNLRQWANIDGCYIIAHVKTDHPSVPVHKKLVRGENEVGCSVIEMTDDPNRCNFYWIVNTDLKIWLPGAVLNNEMTLMLLKYAKDLRNHVQSSKHETS